MSTGFFDFFVLIFRVRDGGSDDESIAWRCRHWDENLPKFRQIFIPIDQHRKFKDEWSLRAGRFHPVSSLFPELSPLRMNRQSEQFQSGQSCSPGSPESGCRKKQGIQSFGNPKFLGGYDFQHTFLGD